MKQLIILFVLSFSLITLSVSASDLISDKETSIQPTYNSGSQWWPEITPEDPDYELYKGVQEKCFCG